MVVIELISNSTSIFILLFISKIKKRGACFFSLLAMKSKEKEKEIE